jgi:hypothetical protein
MRRVVFPHRNGYIPSGVQTFQDLKGGIHDTLPRHAVTTLHFEYRTPAHLKKDARFVQSNPDTSVDPPGSTVHIDERKMEA